MSNYDSSSFLNIEKPKGIERLSNLDILQGKPIPKIDRLRIMSDAQFEDFILEWTDGYLKDKTQEYSSVQQLGGAGDKGRDIVCFVNDERSICDYYQCKHYANALSPAQIYVELGKLCFYVFSNIISLPRKYYFVCPHGVGPKLNDLLADIKRCKEELYVNWDKYCLSGIRSEETPLTQDLKIFIDNIDFSIFDWLKPLELISQHEQTKYHASRFGGGLQKSRGKIPEASSSIIAEELNYTNQLFEVYSEKTGDNLTCKSDLTFYNELKDHFDESRNSFYSAESLKQFSRDNNSNSEEDFFEEFKDEVYTTIRNIARKDDSLGYDKVLNSTQAAINNQYSSNPLHQEIKAQDKEGTCHHLANENKVKWVKKKEL